VADLPTAIVAGRDGALWFTEGDADQVAHLVMASRRVTEYPVPTAANDPAGICVDSHGTIWYTERAGNVLATVSPGGVIHEYPLPVAPASMRH
jgi:virginiamycin B lyase